MHPDLRGRRLRLSDLSGRRAAAAVEFLLVLPLLTLVLLAGIDFARCALVYLRLGGAVDAALSVAGQQCFSDLTRPRWEESIRQAARDHLASLPNFDAAALQMEIVVDADASINVQVDIRYPFRTILPWPNLPSSLLLHHAGSAIHVRQ